MEFVRAEEGEEGGDAALQQPVQYSSRVNKVSPSLPDKAIKQLQLIIHMFSWSSHEWGTVLTLSHT